MSKRLLLTPGEPAGIGPDLCVMLAQKPVAADLLVVGDPQVLTDRARQLGLPVSLKLVSAESLEPQSGNPACAGPGEKPEAEHCGEGSVLNVLPLSTSVPVVPGKLEPANASYVLETLKTATSLCLAGKGAGLVTGPVHKGLINEAGFSFSGHTEFLAELCGTDLTVMMLATEGLRVALATTHLPLKDVPAAITSASLTRVIEILHHDLAHKFGIEAPRILVSGLNPHAGEDGHLGREETDTIIPVLREMRAKGWQLEGPLPADTLFTQKYLDNADAVLAMYHDQGLPVLKFKGFGNACNITLGLPIVRTSVDHGTALDLAGTGDINLGSLDYAIAAARNMASIQGGKPGTNPAD